MHDIRPFIARVEKIVAAHRLEGTPGRYRRWLWQRPDGKPPRDLGLNPYGCADAANILYTIGAFPRDPEERRGWISTLQGLQNPETGLFHEETHHDIHCTAHCIAALELFDAGPRHKLTALAPLREPDALRRFLNDLDWRGDPWRMSHRGAGLYAAMMLAGEATPEWQAAYFDWLWDEADAKTGMWRKGCIGPVASYPGSPVFPHLAGSFHYLFNHEYARRPLRYPAAHVDFCLDIYRSEPKMLGDGVRFNEIDWVYCLNRAVRQSGHRFAEARKTLTEFADRYLAYLTGLDAATHDGLNDLHSLFGAMCAVAELQQALPGTILTEKPLRLVLDRRPFI
jgi:hypothetical protein